MTRKDLRARILELIGFWRPILDLQNWVIHINFSETKILAGCNTDPEYKQGHLSFNLPKIQREMDRGLLDLEELVVHELTHMPLWLMARGMENRNRTKVVEYVEELTTTTISRALLRARQAGEARVKRRG